MQDDCYYLTQTTSDLNLAPLLEFGFIIYPEHILETGETCQMSAEFFYFYCSCAGTNRSSFREQWVNISSHRHVTKEGIRSWPCQMSEGSNRVLLSFEGAAAWGQTGASGGKDQSEEDPEGQGGGAASQTGRIFTINATTGGPHPALLCAGPKSGYMQRVVSEGASDPICKSQNADPIYVLKPFNSHECIDYVLLLAEVGVKSYSDYLKCFKERCCPQSSFTAPVN